MHGAASRNVAPLFALETVVAAHSIVEKVSFHASSTLGCVER